MTFRLPNDTQHIALLGRNGSGKTQAALWHLSKRSFDIQPWIIVDFKRDEHIAAIPYLEEVDVGSLPKFPGLYVTRPSVANPLPLYETLEKAYEQEDTGIVFDEGFILGQNSRVQGMFETLLMQGRSKHIPLITLVQRPVWVSRYVFSESLFFQNFALQDRRDVLTATQVQPEGAFARIPDYHSSYYDVGRNQLDFLAPVPSETKIMQLFGERVDAMRKAAAKKSIARYL